MAEQNGNEQQVKRKKYHKPLNFNIGMVIFVVIGAYILYCLVAYLRSNPVAGYEVKIGSLTSPATYEGLIIRNEEVINSPNAGYVNYYAREGEKMACGDLVYSVDGSGELAELLKSAGDGANSMSDEDFHQIRDEIVTFAKDFNNRKFYPVYDFKYNLQGTTLKLSNLNVLNSIDYINTGRIGNSVQMNNAPKAGYVVFSTDGYENTLSQDITVDDFKKEHYEKKQFVNNELVAAGDPVYKIIGSENWDVIIQTDEQTAQALKEQGTVNVKFLKTQNTCYASTDVVKHGEGTFVILSFRSYASTFATDRFINIEIMTEEKTGLKIPNTAIVEKEFFLIPEEFGTVLGENSDTATFGIQTYNDKGQLLTKYYDLEVYEKKDGYYYIDAPEIELGTVLVKTDSSETFAASRKGTLIGVYNINKGYADFRQITIAYQNEEYSIVTPNSNYGLRAYDYIVLNASSVKDDDMVYQKMAK
ncbi:MAG: hypothetical protein IKP92_08495 [Lachnospiraceae bacterium]|nr:hypothetical protein [Lachnospiraceae bacterium]